MQWLNEPASWQRTGDVLRVSVDPGTDFWRTTGYGYVHDNGHVYGDLLPGDLDVSVRVRGSFTNQYDQAGIMLRADEQTWLKTGLEFFEGRPRLSTVLTMGWSSWMVADLPPGTDEVTLRVSRRGDAVEVRYAAGDGPAELAALVFLPPDREMLAGIVCAAPEGTGFSAAFHDLRIVGREWAGQGAAEGADWVSEPAAAAGWAEEETAATGASWTGDAQGWGDERAEDGSAEWAGDKAEERAARWAGDEAEEEAPGWVRDGAGEGAAGWAGDEAEEEAPGWTGDKPGAAPSSWAGETPAGEPAGRDGAPAESDTLDWAKPQASESAEDWERLSLSVSTSWNAFAAAAPADEPLAEQEQEPAEKPPATGRTRDDSPGSEDARDSTNGAASEGGDGSPDGKGGNDGADGKVNKAGKVNKTSKVSADSKGSSGSKDSSGSNDNAESAGTAGGPPSAAGDKTEPVPPEPGPPPASAAEPGEPEAHERHARRRNKAKPSAPQLPTPADPADEWISLLTADSADELSRPEMNRTRREPDRGGPDPE